MRTCVHPFFTLTMCVRVSNALPHRPAGLPDCLTVKRTPFPLSPSSLPPLSLYGRHACLLRTPPGLPVNKPLASIDRHAYYYVCAFLLSVSHWLIDDWLDRARIHRLFFRTEGRDEGRLARVLVCGVPTTDDSTDGLDGWKDCDRMSALGRTVDGCGCLCARLPASLGGW